MAPRDTDGWDLDEIIPYYQDLEDPRSTIHQRHPLISVWATEFSLSLG